MYKKITIAALLFCAIISFSCVQNKSAVPPVAKIIPHPTEFNGETLEDNYFWLRNRDSSDVLEYITQENEYTAAMMASSDALKDTLYEELIARINENDLSVPYKKDDYYYYTKTEEGKDYDIYCRKLKSIDNDEEIILDINQLAEGHGYFYVGFTAISPNQKYLAYSVDTTGGEIYTIYFKNLETGELFDDMIENVSGDLVWANDNKTVFYLVLDDIHQPYRLYKHMMGKSNDNDELMYEEPDKKFWVDLTKSKSGEFIFLSSGSATSTEVRYLNANKPKSQFVVFKERRPDIEYQLYHIKDKLLILTNENAMNFKVDAVSDTNPQTKKITSFVPYDSTVMISGLETFNDYLALYTRENGLEQIKIIDLKDNSSKMVSFPEDVYTYSPIDNLDFNTDKIRFVYSSSITPRTVYDYNMKTSEKTILKEYEVLGGYDKNNYRTAREFATASDGAKIPISLVYRKDLVKDGSNPLYLYGYGAYGISSEPRFRSYVFSLLDRGFIFAIAHTRGGGEMGRQWYYDGKLFNKINTFTDFIACTEDLIEKKYTSPGKIVAYGGSAGGLLVGYLANERPDLYQTILADVPFVDLMNTMLDPTIPLTVLEYEEWGNPNEKEYFDYMLSYSPYDNVKAHDYPNMLIMTSMFDPRVQYWEPAKWTAKLRATKTDDNLLLLHTNMEGGHGGLSGRYSQYDELAFMLAFVLKTVK